MKTTKYNFIIMLSIPLLILLGMTIKPLSVSYFGDEVLLKTLPVDPADLFYGDYIALNLEIDEIPYEKLGKDVISEIEDTSEEEIRDSLGKLTIYTVIDKNGEVLKTVLSRPDDGLYLKGRIIYYDFHNEKKSVHVDYGLNRFYIEEGSGAEIEKLAVEGDVFVSVRIRHGYGVIAELVTKTE